VSPRVQHAAKCVRPRCGVVQRERDKPRPARSKRECAGKGRRSTGGRTTPWIGQKGKTRGFAQAVGGKGGVGLFGFGCRGKKRIAELVLVGTMKGRMGRGLCAVLKRVKGGGGGWVGAAGEGGKHMGAGLHGELGGELLGRGKRRLYPHARSTKVWGVVMRLRGCGAEEGGGG